jgi:hypothetical protein
MDELSALLESGARKRVYGMQFSLFPLSKKECGSSGDKDRGKKR